MSNHLASVAMLVDFSASQWTARKIDKAASQLVNENAHANGKASHVSKKLIMSDTHGLIQTCVSRARTRHVELTSPWLDAGPRILAAKMHSTYVSDMEKFEAEFWPLVDTFVANYPTYVNRAAEMYAGLGTLFNENDYPAESRIRGKFGWRCEFMPVPTSDDFRVDVGQAAVERIKAGIEARLVESANNAVRDVFERVHDKVSAMVEKLTAYKPAMRSSVDRFGNALSPGRADHGMPDRTQGIFRDSLVENIRDLVDLMPGLNFTGDQRINDLVVSMQALVAHDAETLRASDNLRANVAAQAAAVVAQVSDFMA